MSQTFDLAIIGGGINGCGIARDAAGRGSSVFLCEMGDLAGGTSSRSTKLIHGGFRYLEQYDFRLVREALAEREVLWRIAPHIVRPLRFVLPYQEGLRPAWMLRAGLFLYDHLGGRQRLPGTRVLDLTTDSAGAPLAGFAMADIDAFRFAGGDCFQLSAMAFGNPFHAALCKGSCTAFASGACGVSSRLAARKRQHRRHRGDAGGG